MRVFWSDRRGEVSPEGRESVVVEGQVWGIERRIQRQGCLEPSRRVVVVAAVYRSPPTIWNC